MNTDDANDPAGGDPAGNGRRDRAAPKGVRATVVGPSTNGAFRVRLPGGEEIQAHAAQDLRMALTRLLPGDEVLAEPSPFDPSRARILEILHGARSSAAQRLPNP
jgi:translation initiation factor IF-1